MKKIIFASCFCIPLLLGQALAFFQDVDVTHPYYYSIRNLYDRKIVKGYEVGTERYYRPTTSISRAAALKILMLSSGVETKQPRQNPFPDVYASEWYAPYIQAALEEGIVRGFNDGNFYPGSFVSRAEFLKMTLEAFDAPVNTDEPTDNWYDPYFNVGTEFRIIENGTDPNQQLSRGEVAEIVYRTNLVADDNFKSSYTYQGFGLASYYGDRFHGRSTASGEIYDKTDLTAAHRTLPFGTRLKVTHNGKSVIVRVNDRGPYHPDRIIDLSEAAFSRLAGTGSGVVPIGFELYSYEDETDNPVPEYLREELATETKTPLVPKTVSEVLSTSVIPPKPNLKPYYESSVSRLPTDFFPGITLNRTIPQTVYQGSVLHFTGRVNEDNHEKATVFLKPPSTTSEYDFLFSRELEGRNFSIPVTFDKLGEFKVGIVIDDEKKSRIETIKVVPFPSDRRWNAARTPAIETNDLNIWVDASEQKVSITIPRDFENPSIFWLTMTQPEVQKELFIEGDIDRIHIPYEFFDTFRKNEDLSFDLFQAESKDHTLSEQKSYWTKIQSSQYLVKEGFKDNQTHPDLRVFGFNQYLKQTGNMEINGRINNDGTTIKDIAYITRKGQGVTEVPIDIDGDRFSLTAPFPEYGTYILEFVSESGQIIFNKGVYVYREYVLPLQTWTNSGGILPDTPSRPNIRYWINAIRKAYGERSVVGDPELDAFAQSYSDLMAEGKFVSHTSSDGKNFEQRIREANFKGEYGENLSFGTNASLASNGLENSGSHLKNMIDQKWTKVGIGITRTSKGEYYFAHIFGR